MRAYEYEKPKAQADQEKPKVEEEKKDTEAETKFAGSGNVPPVGGQFDEQKGSADLAFEETTDHERDLKAKVNDLVQTRFDGDLKRAFEHYDLDNNGSVDKGEIINLLADANVGNKVTRGIIADKLVDKGDASRARGGELQLEWSEFQSAFGARALAPS
jgi:hypothetical protein